MALSVDGVASNKGASISSLTASLTTAAAGDIVIALVMNARSNAQGSFATSSMTSTGNLPTWNHRVSALQQRGSAFDNGYGTTDVFWAYAALALTAESIQANFSASVDAAALVTFAVTGFTGTTYHTNPFDLVAPVTGTVNAPTNTPAGELVSTTASNTMVLGLVGSYLESFVPTPTSGFTTAKVDFTGSGANGAFAGVVYDVVSSPQTNLLAGFTDNMEGWMAIGDALAQAGGASGPVKRRIIRPVGLW